MDLAIKSKHRDNGMSSRRKIQAFAPSGALGLANLHRLIWSQSDHGIIKRRENTGTGERDKSLRYSRRRIPWVGC